MPTTQRSGGSTQPTLKRQGSPTAGSASKRPRNSRKTTGGQGRSRRGKKTAPQPANMANEEPGDDPGLKRASRESARHPPDVPQLSKPGNDGPDDKQGGEDAPDDQQEL